MSSNELRRVKDLRTPETIPQWEPGEERTVGTIRRWLPLKGHGVIDSDETPGGCWVHFSNFVGYGMPGIDQLAPGVAVLFTWQPARQDSFNFRAVKFSLA